MRSILELCIFFVLISAALEAVDAERMLADTSLGRKVSAGASDASKGATASPTSSTTSSTGSTPASSKPTGNNPTASTATGTGSAPKDGDDDDINDSYGTSGSGLSNTPETHYSVNSYTTKHPAPGKR